MSLRKLASKFETLYILTLKQRHMKSLRILFDWGLSFEFDTFLGSLQSRNIIFDVVYLDRENPCSIFSHIWRKLYYCTNCFYVLFWREQLYWRYNIYIIIMKNEVIDIKHQFFKTVLFSLMDFKPCPKKALCWEQNIVKILFRNPI